VNEERNVAKNLGVEASKAGGTNPGRGKGGKGSHKKRNLRSISGRKGPVSWGNGNRITLVSELWGLNPRERI